MEDVKILLESSQPVSEDQPNRKKNPTQLVLRIPENGDRNMLQNIKQCLERYPGNVPVSLLLPSVDGPKEMKITLKAEASERLYSQLGFLIGSDQVSFI